MPQTYVWLTGDTAAAYAVAIFLIAFVFGLVSGYVLGRR
jgi:hypothetical protein